MSTVMPRCRNWVGSGWLVVSSRIAAVAASCGAVSGLSDDRGTLGRPVSAPWCSRHGRSSSRPHRSPGRPDPHGASHHQVRVLRRWGRPGSVSAGLHPRRCTGVDRYRLAKLRWLDVHWSGHPPHGISPLRDLVHVDVKKLGKIPAAEAGECSVTPSAGTTLVPIAAAHQQQVPQSAAGLSLLAYRLDAHSRLAYSELLADERKETAAAFWLRANTGSRTAASRCETC